MARLEAQQVNGRLVFHNARERLLRLLEAEAREADLLPRAFKFGKRLFNRMVKNTPSLVSHVRVIG